MSDPYFRSMIVRACVRATTQRCEASEIRKDDKAILVNYKTPHPSWICSETSRGRIPMIPTCTVYCTYYATSFVFVVDRANMLFDERTTGGGVGDTKNASL